MRKKANTEKEWTVTLPDTPVGPVRLYFSERGLTALEFGSARGQAAPEEEAPPALAPMMAAVRKGLTAYFAGHPADLSSLALAPQGTQFQLRVWQELRKIPRGTTISYGELARRVGSPKASRAVGQANGSNPIPVIIPCHRVIAADGSLGGYSSGLERKRWLLEHEKGSSER